MSEPMTAGDCQIVVLEPGEQGKLIAAYREWCALHVLGSLGIPVVKDPPWHEVDVKMVIKGGRYSPLTTDLTAGEVNAQRTEADRDFH